MVPLMSKDAIHSPCYQCDYIKYCKMAKYKVIDRNGEILKFVAAVERAEIPNGAKKQINPCYTCEKPKAYNAQIDAIYPNYPASYAQHAWSYYYKINYETETEATIDLESMES